MINHWWYMWVACAVCNLSIADTYKLLTSPLMWNIKYSFTWHTDGAESSAKRLALYHMCQGIPLLVHAVLLYIQSSSLFLISQPKTSISNTFSAKKCVDNFSSSLLSLFILSKHRSLSQLCVIENIYFLWIFRKTSTVWTPEFFNFHLSMRNVMCGLRRRKIYVLLQVQRTLL